MPASEQTLQLAEAAAGGKRKAIRKLIDKGADVNRRHNGAPILWYALKSGDRDSVQLLIDAGADPNDTVHVELKGGAEQKRTLLMTAVNSDKSEVISTLLELGADVNRRDKKSGETALQIACRLGRRRCARLLVAGGADVNDRSRGGTYVLMLAVGVGNLPIVRVLLEAGAEASVLDRHGNNVFSYVKRTPLSKKAQRRKKKATAKAKASQVAPTQESATVSTKSGIDKEMFRLLLEHGVKLYPRCVRYKIQVTCDECSQPIMVNGPLKRVTCASCLSDKRLAADFWKRLFKDTTRHKGASISPWKLEFQKSAPACPECQTHLDLSTLGAVKDDSVGCAQCDASFPTFRAPGWLRKIDANEERAERVFFAERPGGDSDTQVDSPQPVAVRCISCAAPLTITVETPRNALCEHCNTAQYLPDPLWLSLHPVKKAADWWVVFADVEQ